MAVLLEPLLLLVLKASDLVDVTPRMMPRTEETNNSAKPDGYNRSSGAVWTIFATSQQEVLI